MRLELKNIGVVEYANIRVGGLTVLTGWNNIGKSIIGKTVFGLVHTVSDAHITYEDNILDELRDEIIAETITSSAKPSLNFNAFNFIITKCIGANYPEAYLQEITNIAIDNLITNPKTRKLDNDDEYSELKAKLSSKIIEKLNIHDNMGEVYQKFFNQFIKNSFSNKINNQYNLGVKGEISLIDYDETVCIKAIINDNITEVFHENNERLVGITFVDDFFESRFTYHNATYVDTPFILQQARFITSRLAFSRREDTEILQSYDLIRDLVGKLQVKQSLNAPMFFHDSLDSIIAMVYSATEGEVYYDKEANRFMFREEKWGTTKDFDINNVASGVKAFGILQLLLKNGYIEPNTVLIIDEPEVHLHPEWQLKYAEVLVLLAQAGVWVIVSTHSNYMIKAIQRYSEKHSMRDETRFYLGERKETGTTFTDVSENLEPIFKLLAEPLIDLKFL